MLFNLIGHHSYRIPIRFFVPNFKKEELVISQLRRVIAKGGNYELFRRVLQ